MADQSKPIIFLAFANPPAGARDHLRNLGEEGRRLESTLQQAEQQGLCELQVKPYATLDDILTMFRDHRNRIAIFHYGGHAHNYHLLLEDAKEGTAAAHAGGLAAFLGQQRGLQLVFLNGCATQPQVEGLLAANVPAVIATAQAIKDEVAMNFASNFYQSLASGANLQTAYAEAEAAVRSSPGSSDTRDTYRSSTRDAAIEGETPLADRWPWALYVKPGAEATYDWNLPDAVGDPLFGLPTLPELDPPESPFRHLHWFERAHAQVFFGRGYEIRNLYEQVAAAQTPIILLYGQSGVGKSSLLAAGLMPRLEADYDSRYTRRDRELGLSGTLRRTLGETAQERSLAEAWRQVDTPDRPLVVVLDQLEEVYTRPQTGQPDEFDQLLTELQDLFGSSGARPPGKLILGFRKEWLADIEKRLQEHRLPRAKLFLERLGRKGIVEAILGPAQSERLQATFGLTIAKELPGGEKLPDVIADDLLEDRDSPIAPTLQILLTKMWERAKAENYDRPHFDLDLYQSLKREGLLLNDFLEQQLTALAAWRKDVVASGLALDLLAFHTTPQGTAEQRSQSQLLGMYAHLQDDIAGIVQQCEDLYLLVDPSKNQPGQPKASRLAHDALAPLVRQQFDESDAPGQRARRILENMAKGWRNTADGISREGTPLGEVELKMVENGRSGMRDWTEKEERLVTTSQAAQAIRERNRIIGRIAGIAAVSIIVVIAGALWRLWGEARQSEREARASDLVSKGQLEFEDKPMLGVRLALEGLVLIPPGNIEGTSSTVTLIREKMTNWGRLLKLNFVNDVIFSPDEAASIFVVDYADAPGELRRTADGSLINKLHGNVERVTFSSGESASFFVVDYVGAPGELRRTKDGSIIEVLTDEVVFVTSRPDEAVSFFVIHYSKAPGELRSAIDGSVIEILSDIVLEVNFTRDKPASLFIVDFLNDPDELRLSTNTSSVDVRNDRQWSLGVGPDEVSPSFVVDYSNAPGELRRTADGSLITTLSDEVVEVTFSSDNAVSYVVLGYSNAPGELRRTADGSLITTLSDEVVEVTFSPDEASSVFIVTYVEAIELRRTADGSLIKRLDYTDSIGLEVKFSLDKSTSLFVVDYFDNSSLGFLGVPGSGGMAQSVPLDELRRTADGSLITTLSDEVVEVTFSPDEASSVFIVTYIEAIELRRTADGSLIENLNSQVEKVTFSPDEAASAFIVQYSDALGELRRTADGSLIKTLNGQVEKVTFSPDKAAPFLIVGYANQEWELWQWPEKSYRLAPLGQGIGKHEYILKHERLYIWHQDGRVYLLDLAWLQEMGGDQKSLNASELIQLACQGPFSHGSFDENILYDVDYLYDNPSRICQHQH